MPCLDEARAMLAATGAVPLDAATHEHVAHCHACRALLVVAARSLSARVPKAVEPSCSPGELFVGDHVAGYELERFLGSGAMGVVWAARREGTSWALKFGRGRDPSERRRFEREARLAATVRHPNLVRIEAVVPAQGEHGPIVVMERLEGSTLAHSLARGQVQDAWFVLRAIAAALAALHAQRIVHRDLKPENVFLTADSVKVLDFGVAKQLGDGAGSFRTTTGSLVGTPRYMAPEQFLGDHSVDERADVWALGMLAFVLLTGRHPLDATTPGDLMKTYLRGAPTPARLPADVTDAARARWVDGALDYDRAARPTVAALLALL